MDKDKLELEVTLLHERVCSALSDTTRIMILYLLAEGDLYVNEIAEALDAPQSTISRHLKILRDRNLVTAERQGTAVQYSITDKRIIQSLDLMRAILNDQMREAAEISRALTGTSYDSKEKK